MDIRLLTESDLPAAMSLKEAAGWNQTEQDWRLLVRLQPDGCFALEHDGRVAASATAYCYGNELAWIGMVLTLPECRGRGFGNRVFLRSVEFCRQRGIRCVKLDATDMGQRLYERAGFAGEYSVERWGGTAPRTPAAETAHALTGAQLTSLLALDAEAFGVPRGALLRALHAGCDWSAFVEGGYALARPGSKARYFGPCVARDAGAARRLFHALLAAYPGEPVFVDVPAPNQAARDVLREAGFEVRRTLLRMYLGPNGRPGDPSLVFGLAGFEYG